MSKTYRQLAKARVSSLSLLNALGTGMILPAHAHHVAVNSPASEAGPIITLSPDTPEQGTLNASVQVQVVDYEAFPNDELTSFTEAGIEGVHSTHSAYVTSIGINYAVTDRLSLGVVAPFVLRNTIREAGHHDTGGVPEIETLGDVEGFGDLQLLAKYQLPTLAKTRLAIVGRVQVPTGDTNEQDNEGHRFETEFQPGSGAWAVGIGGAAARSFGPVSLTSSGLYTFVEEGAQDTDLGDRVTLDFAASYRIGKGDHIHADGEKERHQAVDLVLELNGEWQARERIAGVVDRNSGGTQVFLSPGIRYSAAGGWSSFVSLGLPLQENLGGIQNDTSVRVSTGFGVTF